MINPNQAPSLTESGEAEKPDEISEVINLARRIVNLSGKGRTEAGYVNDAGSSGVDKDGVWHGASKFHVSRVSTGGRLIKVKPFQIGEKQHDGVFVCISPEGVEPDGYPVGIITLGSVELDNFYIEGNVETGFDIRQVSGQHHQSLKPGMIEDLISGMSSVEDKLVAEWAADLAIRQAAIAA